MRPHDLVRCRSLCTLFTIGLTLAAAVPLVQAAPMRPVEEVRVWYGWTGAQAAQFQELIRRFNATHPGIRVVGLRGINYQRLLTGIAAGSPPDLAELDYHEVGEWAQSGWIEPLAPFLSRSGIRLAAFSPKALATGMYRGQLYGLPFTEDDLALYYNASLLQAHHLSPPRTLAQLASEAQALTVRGRDGAIQILGFDPAYPGSNLALYIRAFGGQIFTPDLRRITPFNPGVQAAIRWEAAFFQQVGPQAMDQFQAQAGKLTAPHNAFVAGRLAFVVAGEWLQAKLRQYAPRFRYGVVPFPAAGASLPVPTTIQGGVWVVPHGADHAQAAMTFLSWLETPSVQETVALHSANLPTLLPARRDPAVQHSYPYESLFLRLADSPGADVMPDTLVSGTYFEALANAETQVLQAKWSLNAALTRVAALQRYLAEGISPLHPISPTVPLGYDLVAELVQARPYPLVLHPGGPPLFVARSPESFTQTGALYRDTMRGRFRVYAYERNATGRLVDVGLAFSNTDHGMLYVYMADHGVAVNPYPDLAGNLAVKAFLVGHAAPWVRIATVGPGRTVYLLHPLKPGYTSCGLYDFYISRAGPGGPPAAAVVSSVALRNPLPADPLTLPVVPHDLNPRGTYPTSQVSGTLVVNPAAGPVSFDIGKIPLYSGGTDLTPGEYVVGYDAVDHTAVMNNGNFGVFYYLTIRLENPGPKTQYATLLLQNLGGGGHYIAALDGDIRLTDFIRFYQSYVFGSLVVPPGGRTYTLTVTVPGGSTAPERVYIVPRT